MLSSSLSEKPARKPLTGVEACALGALEAGARLATGYPGTPATPAIDYLMAHGSGQMRVEWALNEKVALEIAAGHSWAGQRSFVAMKMSGLNVAADALLSVATSGTRGGLVVYVGDDPGMHYGMVEQDSRLWARMAFLPMVEPGSPQEAKDLTAEVFRVSEEVEAPVLVRGTSTTANTCASVSLGRPQQERRPSAVPFDVDRYTKAGAARCLRQHAAALSRLEAAGRRLERWNTLYPEDSPLGVIASASTWDYVRESLAGAARPLPNRLRVVVMNPLPDDRILELLGRCSRVLVVEELEAYMEERVRALAGTLPAPPQVLGKRDGILSPVGDFDPEVVAGALAVLEGRADPVPRPVPEPSEVAGWAPRLLTFCPGCPHRSSYAALERAIAKAGFSKEEVIVTGDIGCTIIGMNPPYSLCRTEVAMGSSIALAQGFAYAGVDRPVVATIGDSTFFHAGIPALLNAAAQRVNLTVLVLDNGYAAMTGYQPSPGNLRAGGAPNPLSIEELAGAARVRHVRKAFPYFTRRLARILAQAMKSPGVNVVIAEAPCVARLPHRTVVPYQVRPDRCTGPAACSTSCLEKTGCPALNLDPEADKAVIDAARCLGCGLCASACAPKAIRRDLRSRRRTA